MSEQRIIPVMRTSGSDFDAMLGYYACIAELGAVEKVMEKRIRSIPGGWRDFRLVEAKLDKLGDDLMLTIPKEKLRNLSKMAHRVRFHMTIGPQATSTASTSDTVIGFDDLDVLIDAARDRCKMCTDWSRGKCDRCELGKVMDRVLRYDRKGDSWDNISDTDIANE